MKSNRLKQIGILMSFAISLMAVGCGGNEQQSNIPGSTETEGGLSVNTAGAETEKNKEDNENKERVPDTASDVSLDEPISYTYQNHPYSFMAGEKELAIRSCIRRRWKRHFRRETLRVFIRQK